MRRRGQGNSFIAQMHPAWKWWGHWAVCDAAWHSWGGEEQAKSLEGRRKGLPASAHLSGRGQGEGPPRCPRRTWELSSPSLQPMGLSPFNQLPSRLLDWVMGQRAQGRCSDLQTLPAAIYKRGPRTLSSVFLRQSSEVPMTSGCGGESEVGGWGQGCG